MRATPGPVRVRACTSGTRPSAVSSVHGCSASDPGDARAARALEHRRRADPGLQRYRDPPRESTTPEPKAPTIVPGTFVHRTLSADGKRKPRIKIRVGDQLGLKVRPRTARAWSRSPTSASSATSSRRSQRILTCSRSRPGASSCAWSTNVRLRESRSPPAVSPAAATRTLPRGEERRRDARGELSELSREALRRLVRKLAGPVAQVGTDQRSPVDRDRDLRCSIAAAFAARRGLRCPSPLPPQPATGSRATSRSPSASMPSNRSVSPAK